MAQKRAKSSWIAERMLRVGTHRRARLLVRLGKPQEVSANEWKCPVEIVSGNKPTSVDIHGFDAFQSLILALGFIRDELASIHRPVTWLGGDEEDPGFRLLVLPPPPIVGRGFASKLERLIQAELRRVNRIFRRRLERRHRRK